MDRKIKTEVKEYLTLLFGKLAKERRDDQWREVRRQADLKFHYQVTDQFDLEAHLNAIFFSLQYHLNFVFLTKVRPGQGLEGTGAKASRQTFNYLGKA